MNEKSNFYPKKDSFFYNLKNRSRLEKFLGLDKGYLKKENLEEVIHYSVFIQNKNGKAREIEAPCKDLKNIQKRLYRYFKRIETPNWLISGKKGLSYIDNSSPHVEKNYVVCTDISKFYPSCSQKMVYDFFRCEFNMSKDIAGLLTRLTTRNGHVATGTPTSQIIAFWCAEKMFDEIAELAELNNITFTLYVDDMTFSSDCRISKSFVWEINKICRKHGFIIKNKKTKYYAKRDYKIITGVCISPQKIKIVPNRLQRKIYSEKELIVNNIGEPIDLRRIKGLILAAQQIDIKRYHNIEQFILEYEAKLNDEHADSHHSPRCHGSCEASTASLFPLRR